jgi:glutamine synthetase
MSYAPVLNWAVTKNYSNLEQNGMFQAEYIWIGGSGHDLRCKTKTMTSEPKGIADFPVWNFDGSSTGQAPGRDSEVYLVPVAYYPDPFRPTKGNYLVLCECVLPDGKQTPIPTNTRRHCNEQMERVKAHVPWFGIEQEFTLFEKDGVTPLGWPKFGYPGPQGPYYCSIGTQNAYGRQVVESIYKALMFANIKISGCNGEVLPGQWEYQIGPCEGIEAGDSVVMARFISQRICEDYGVIISFDPKPIPGDWNGSGCHTNFSTKAMREEKGFEVIMEAISRLEKKHDEHIAVYGTGNERRLTGLHETAPITKFSAGVANRGASIRIPRTTKFDGKGYFEDRRPASNMDPYLVTAKLVTTCVLNE